MTHARTEIAALPLALAVALTACTAKPEGPAADLVISGARVIDTASGSASPPRDVWIVGDEVREVVTAGIRAAPAGATVIDGSGLFLLPGLIDVHAHIGDGGLARNTDEERIEAFDQFLRYGVTTIFAPGGGGGNDAQLGDWKRRCESGELRCPRLLGSGDLLTAPGSHPISTIFALPADTDAATLHGLGVTAVAEDDPVEPILERKVAAGVDAIKIAVEDGPAPWYPKPRLSTAKAREIVDASHERGLRVFAHVSNAALLADAVSAGVDAIMHSSQTGIREEELARMAERGVYYVATLTLFDGLMDGALGRFEEEPYAALGASPKALESLRNVEQPPRRISDEELAAWKGVLAGNLRRARDAGVPLALGTDTNNPTVYPGYSAHEELALMVGYGLTPAEALAAATVGGAGMLERSGEIGRIAPGFRADLVALRADPLADILNSRRIAFVVTQGRLRRDVVSADDLPEPSSPSPR